MQIFTRRSFVRPFFHRHDSDNTTGLQRKTGGYLYEGLYEVRVAEAQNIAAAACGAVVAGMSDGRQVGHAQCRGGVALAAAGVRLRGRVTHGPRQLCRVADQLRRGGQAIWVGGRHRMTK